MTRLAFDIYPADDPKDGARLVRLTNQHYGAGTYYQHFIPIGKGLIVVERHQSVATEANFAIGNYVRVRDLDLNADDDLNVIGGFWLEEGQDKTVSDDSEYMRRGGPSTLAYIARALLGPESLSPFEGPNSIVDGRWRWGVDSYGGVLRRALLEANLQTPPGLPDIFFTVSGGVIIGNGVQWDDATDSNSVAWPTFAGEYSTPVGTNLVRLANDIFGFGLELRIDPHTFQLYAYNADGMGTNRTSGSFAAGKVRLLAGTNIAADLERGIHGSVRLTHLLIGSSDMNYGWVESDDYSPGDPVRKAFYQTGDISGDPSTNAVIIARAQRNMDLRGLAEDAVRVPLGRTGDDELNGRYQPGPDDIGGHVWTGDIVTLHTGALTTDYVNAAKRVIGVSYDLREGGDWAVTLDLGARFTNLDGRPVQNIAPGVGCTCLQFCVDEPAPALDQFNYTPTGGTLASDADEMADGDPDTYDIVQLRGQGAAIVRGYVSPATISSYRILQGLTGVEGATRSGWRVYHSDDFTPGDNAHLTGTWTECDNAESIASSSDSGDRPISAGAHLGWMWVSTVYDEGGPLQTDWVVRELTVVDSVSGITGGPDATAGDDPCVVHGDHDHDIEGVVEPLIAGHVDDTADAHDASAVSVVPFGSIAATDVQAALEEIIAEASPGVTDHGALTGLSDDDHPQYLTEAEGDAAYAGIGHAHGPGVVTAEFSGVAVHRTGGSLQNVSTDTHTALIYEVEDIDTDDYWDVAQPSRITIPADGWYEFHGEFRLSGEATFDTSDGNFFNGRFRIDGATTSDNLFGDDYHRAISALSSGSVNAHGFHYLTEGQYVELIAFQHSGETLTVPQASIGSEHGWSRLFVRRVQDGLSADDVRDVGRWEPVTNGDVGAPELIFEDGDVVMEWVAG